MTEGATGLHHCSRLVLDAARMLARKPDVVQVREVWPGPDELVVTIDPGPEHRNIGAVIGRGGEYIEALRAFMLLAGRARGLHVRIRVEEPDRVAAAAGGRNGR